ncbi:MAG: hypothetical protein ACKV19_11535 [Verrucomicrobiales bacterium]
MADATPAFQFAPGDLSIALNGGLITVGFLGAPAQDDALESRGDLVTWQVLATFRTDVLDREEFEDPSASDLHFYRVRSATPTPP